MNVVKNGYVAGAVLLQPFVKQVREHVESEKFMARCEVDNDTTRQFQQNTVELKDQRYNLRYNNPNAIKLTQFGKNNAS